MTTICALPQGYPLLELSWCRVPLRMALVLGLGLLSACTAAPWSVRVENATTEEISAVDCALRWSDHGYSGATAPLSPGETLVVASGSSEAAPAVELRVRWAEDERPQSIPLAAWPHAERRLIVRLLAQRRTELVAER